jgi:acyl-CoA thioester hydrolase
MPRIHVQPVTVTGEVIDVNGHVNNLAYLRWMQEVAIGHSSACGWPLERYQEARAGWVVRSHYIEYLAPAVSGDEIAVLTWVADMRRQSSRRKYLFWRAEGARVLARAETMWVFVDPATGRSRPIPPELRTAFTIVGDDEDVLASAGLRPA